MFKKIISFLLVTAMMMSVSAAVGVSAADAKELIKNGSFEMGIAGWNSDSEDVGTVEDSKAPDGELALSLKSKGTAVFAYQLVKSLTAEMKLSFSGELKTVKLTGQAGIKFEFYEGNTQLGGGNSDISQGINPTNGKWQKINKTITVPNGADRVRVVLRLNGEGEALWDNISLTTEATAERTKYEWENDYLTKEFEKLGMDREEMMEFADDDSEDFVLPITRNLFSDIKGHTHEAAINLLGDLGIVNGKDEGLFMPEDSLTRAEIVTILLRVFGEKTPADVQIFEDVPKDHWAFDKVMGAYEMGIVNGMSDKIFAPDAPVTYEQAVKMLVCALKCEEDAKALGGYPTGYLEKAKQLNILSETEQDTTASISRAVMARLVSNSIDVTSLGVKYTNIKDNVIYLKNAPAGMEYVEITEEMPLYTNEGVIQKDSDQCYEWDTLSIIKSVSGQELKYVRTPYFGGDRQFVYDAYDWIEEEKIRGSYSWGWGENDPVGQRMEEIGFNLNLQSDGQTFDATTDAFVDTWNNKWKKEYGMKLFMSLSYGNSNYVKSVTAYGTYHTGREKTYTRMPCPLSEEYWENQVIQRAAYVAKKVDGVAFDMEMYATDVSHFSGPCMCDDCFVKYIEDYDYMSDPEVRDIPTTRRASTLQKYNLLNEYTRWQADKLSMMLRRYERLLHKLNPDLIFGYLPNYEWVQGITRGMGTPEMPVIVFSEKEYSGGLDGTPSTINTMKFAGMPAIYAVGLSNHFLSPEVMGDRIKQATTLDGGWWVYEKSYWQSRKRDHHVDRTAEEYFAEIEAAHKRVDEILETGEVVTITPREVNTYTVAKIEGLKPTDDDWKDVPYTEEFVNYQTAEKGKMKTVAQMLHNGTSLFVKFTNYDPEIGKLAAAETDRDASTIWKGDANEIFWHKEGDSIAVHQIVNWAGTVYDSYIGAGAAESSSYDFDIKTDVKVEKDKWISVVEFPMTILDGQYSKSGDVLRVLLARHSPRFGNLAWTPTYGTYIGAPDLWGRVILE